MITARKNREKESMQTSKSSEMSSLTAVRYGRVRETFHLFLSILNIICAFFTIVNHERYGELLNFPFSSETRQFVVDIRFFQLLPVSH